MKLIPESVINAQILTHCIGIDPTCFLHHLQLSHIVEHGMSTCVNRTPYDYILRILSYVAPIKLLKMTWSI